MTIYVVQFGEYPSDNEIKVYSTRERADKVAADANRKYREEHPDSGGFQYAVVDELEVDAD